MLQFDRQKMEFVGPAGRLALAQDDEITRRLAMLIEGECMGLGGTEAAAKYEYCKQRYSQLLAAFRAGGAAALRSGRRGPKRNYRRTDELVRQVIRHRFLHPDATVEVVAQKLRQNGFVISTRSVRRVIDEFGLQKKTLRLPPPGRRANPRS